MDSNDEDQTSVSARVTRACRFIEAAEVLPTLAEVAAHVELSPSHLHRIFKRQMGLTPRAYGAALRSVRLREALDSGVSITEAIFEAGYGSSGRFYEESNEVLGMTPTQYCRGGADAQVHFAIGQCSLGAILVARSKLGVCANLIGDEADALARELQEKFPKARLIGADAGFEEYVARVVGLVEAPQKGLDLPLDVQGTAFQQRVWQAHCEIPVGETATYSEVARGIGAPNSARAVAQACGANKLAVAIPCHRVVAMDGSLSGYKWGVERKRALLEREKQP